MLGKSLIKHKKRTLFYAYHSCAQEAQFKRIQMQAKQTYRMPTSLQLLQTRVYSSIVAQQVEQRQRVELGDV